MPKTPHSSWMSFTRSPCVAPERADRQAWSSIVERGIADLDDRHAGAVLDRGREDVVELLLDLVHLALRGDGQLLHQQLARGVEQAPLAERQGLLVSQKVKVAQDLGNVVDGTGLELLDVPA